MIFQPEFVGVDNGNVRTKTRHCNLGNNLIISASPPQLSKENTMLMDGQYYTAIDKRTLYKRDKTKDRDTYFLTHLAIAQELEHRVIEGTIAPQDIYFVHLGVGLPFIDLKIPGYAKRFQEYFEAPHRTTVTLNGNVFQFQIDEVMVFPQGYSGIVDRLDHIREEGDVVLIDIGGWTKDVVPLFDGQPVIGQANSYKYGSIHFMNDAIRQLADRFNAPAADSDIERILKRKKHHYSAEEAGFVFSAAQKYANQGISVLHEAGLELQRKLSVFIGGGSLLLEPFLEQNDLLGPHEFIRNTGANAIGFERLLRAAYRSR